MEVPQERQANEDERTGIAGQRIHRRALLASAASGFLVLSVGAEVPRPRGDGYPCGGYVAGNLTADVTCGVSGATDASCGLPVTEDDFGGPVGVDHACSEYDGDCGEPGSGSYYHSDSSCSPENSPDFDCGLPGSPDGEDMQDNAT